MINCAPFPCLFTSLPFVPDGSANGSQVNSNSEIHR